MARYGKLSAKEGETDVFVISNAVDSSVDLGSDYVLLPESPAYGIGDEYNSSTQTFIVVTNLERYEDSAFFIKDNTDTSQSLLQESDWTVLPDVGLTPENVADWKTYRASLRVIRKNPSSTGHDNFPDKPDIIYS